MPRFCLLVVSLPLFGCSGNREGSSGGDNPQPGAVARVQGAGATFPNPLYQKWLSEYGKLNDNIRIDYQSIGSGGGIKQIQARTVDFGATDVPMSDEDLQKTQGKLLHIPTVAGAVVITYNVPGIEKPLHFSSEVLADIFLGKIKRWDDARLKADNPGVNLPAENITVVHRSDGSGTSAVFTDYLSKISPEWKQKVGSGASPNWPTGLGGKGNEGVAGQVKQTPHTIGYVEYIYAAQNKLPIGLIKNRAGNIVEPTLEAVTAAAAESVASTPEDLRVSITDASGAGAYPISSYTYMLVYQDQKDAVKGKALIDFLWWALHDGEKFAVELKYAPLPAEIVKKAEAQINSITSGGKPLRGQLSAGT
ncbi:MAG: phosphate ABC transporter substrate-binding protein PstS [Pyrinomonadaceae bacterium]